MFRWLLCALHGPSVASTSLILDVMRLTKPQALLLPVIKFCRNSQHIYGKHFSTHFFILFYGRYSNAMARFFREQDIDEFRDCFHLNTRGGQIQSVTELSVIMRSLGMSPTITELKKYFADKGGKIAFADFLDVMHTHSQKENIPKEIQDAFQAGDRGQSGQISARDLRHILHSWGERLSPREVDRIFREANVNPGGYVRYQDFIRVVCAPVPDYY